jgi:hypothetical protein
MANKLEGKGARFFIMTMVCYSFYYLLYGEGGGEGMERGRELGCVWSKVDLLSIFAPSDGQYISLFAG